MRKLTVVLLCITVIAVSLVIGGSKERTQAADTVVAGATYPKPSGATGTIDGAKSPELIPDTAAYSVLFRLISNRTTDAEKGRIRAYIRQMGLGNQECPTCAFSTASADADIDALIAVAEEFHRRVGALDTQAKEIKDRNWPSPSPAVMAKLTELQQQKDAITAEMIAALRTRLSATGLEKIRRQINERVKPKIKLTQGPQSPPTGPGWQQRSPSRHH